MDVGDKAKLARIEANTLNMDRSFINHERQDTERFERTFKFVKEGFEKIDDRFDKMDEKLGALWDLKNKQEGAFGMGKIVAGIVGGALVAAIDFFLSKNV